MGNKTIVNFFWSGDGWTYLHDMTIKSHIISGNIPTIWIHGKTPDSVYWDDDIYQKNCVIKNADDILDITKFMKQGGNFKTASSLWRFKLLYDYGGWYADTDAVALKQWPTDMEWVVSENMENKFSTGVLKVPPGQSMFLDMMDNIKKNWGNVGVFNDHCVLDKPTIERIMFFPFQWTEWDFLLLDKSSLTDKLGFDISECYSVHLYHTMYERNGIIKNIEKVLINNKNSVLGQLDKWIKESL